MMNFLTKKKKNLKRVRLTAVAIFKYIHILCLMPPAVQAIIFIVYLHMSHSVKNET